MSQTASAAAPKKAAAPRKPKADAGAAPAVAQKPASAKPAKLANAKAKDADAAPKKPRAKKAPAAAAAPVEAIAALDKGRKASAKVAGKGKAAVQKPVAEVKAAASKVGKVPAKRLAGAHVRKPVQEVGVVARGRVVAMSKRYRLPPIQRAALELITKHIVARTEAYLDGGAVFMQHANRKSMQHDDLANSVRVDNSRNEQRVYSAHTAGYSKNDVHGFGYINRRMRIARKSHPTGDDDDE